MQIIRDRPHPPIYLPCKHLGQHFTCVLPPMASKTLQVCKKQSTGNICIPSHGTAVWKSPNSVSNLLHDPKRERSKWRRRSSTTSWATYLSATEAEIGHNRCKACETWLWTAPMSIAPTRRRPVNKKEIKDVSYTIFSGKSSSMFPLSVAIVSCSTYSNRHLIYQKGWYLLLQGPYFNAILTAISDNCLVADR